MLVAFESQEMALPIMLDPRMLKDTLSLVFKEDFRFEDGYDMKQERKALKTLHDGEPDAADQGLPPTFVTPAPGNARLKGKCCQLPTKMSAAEHEPAAAWLTFAFHTEAQLAVPQEMEKQVGCQVGAYPMP